GIDKFFSECHRCGIDGIIIADLPIEEFDEFESIANNYNIYLIRIITPVSGKRIKKITNGAKGFLYCVSTNGVTGTRNSYTTDFNKFRKEYGRDAKIPTALGFGISTPEQVKELKEYADAIIIGSAIVNIIEEYKEECIPRVIKYIEEIKATLSN
ncbi:MAG: tryptophan synthase subunit alpha, partial [Erysipelotrichaceae bacterium]